MSGATQQRLVDAALTYATRGWPVFPVFEPTQAGTCSCGNLQCGSPGKHPRAAHGLNDATTDPERIRLWWAEWPQANVGIRTGQAAGIVVLDVDPGGDVTLARLVSEHGELPAAPQVATGRGGKHIFFAHPGVEVSNTAGANGRLGYGLDLRGDGGYVVAPPSRHVTGATYSWAVNSIPPAPMPSWLLDMVRKLKPSPSMAPAALPKLGRSTSYGEAALEAEFERVCHAQVGERNHVLNRAAYSLGQLVGGGQLGRGDVETVLASAATALGLGDKEATATIASGINAGLQEPRSPPVSEPRAKAKQTAGASGPSTSSQRLATAAQRKEGTPRPAPVGSGAPALRAPASVRSAADLLANPPAEVPTLLEPALIVRGGITCLAAPTKVGKTNLWMHFAWALTEGKSLFGIFSAVKPVNVLLVELELSEAIMHRRLKPLKEALGWTPEGLDRFKIVCQRSLLLDRRDGAKRLVGMIQDHRPDIVIVDSYNAAMAGDPDKSAESRRGLQTLREAQEATGVAFGITSEIRKPPPGQRLRFGVDDLKGSNEVAYDADAVLMLKPLDESRRRLSVVFSAMRHSTEEPPDDLVLIREGLSFSLQHRQGAGAEEAMERAVEEALRKHFAAGGGKTARDCYQAVKTAGLKVRREITDVVRQRLTGQST